MARRKKTPALTSGVPFDGTIQTGQIQDVPTLQFMLKQQIETNQLGIERLRKARAQRDEARSRAARLQGELELWLRTARATGRHSATCAAERRQRHLRDIGPSTETLPVPENGPCDCGLVES
jgi:hypothetical protein